MDPIKSLPSELITEAFSLLSDPQFAIASSASSGWRSRLFNDSSIHIVLDLTDLGKPLEPQELIKVGHRLAFLSTHPRNEILLDLTFLWKTHVEARK